MAIVAMGITTIMIDQEIKIIEEIAATKNKIMMGGEEKGQDRHLMKDQDKGTDTTKAIKEEEATLDKTKEDRDSLTPTLKGMLNNYSKD